MLQITKSVTLSGQSVIEKDGINVVAVVMSAQISENSEYSSVSRTIQDRDLYIKNKSACKDDIAAFDNKVDEYVGGSNNEN